MIKRLNSVYTKSISNKQIVNSIETWNNRQIEEICRVDHYAISTEGLKDIFDKFIEVISKIIRAITDVIRKILGKKTKKEIINSLKEEIREGNENQRARFVCEVQSKLETFKYWFPNINHPVFPDLSSYDVSQLKTLMSEINKINSQFIQISNAIGLAPGRATHERKHDAENMTRLLKNFEEKFLNVFDGITPESVMKDPIIDIEKRVHSIISMLKLKPKVYTPNSKDPVSTFSILTDFVEKTEKFINDVNSAFLNPLQVALTGMEHSVKKMRSYLDKNYEDTNYQAFTTLLSSYTKFAGSIQRVYVYPVSHACARISSAASYLVNQKWFHDSMARHINNYYGSDIKKYEKKLF